MKLATKVVATLLLATIVPDRPDEAFSRVSVRHRSQFDYLLRRHDRKGELRAELLNIAPTAFRHMQKHMSLEQIARRYGFVNIRAFRLALFGKLKDELRRRGWSVRQIDLYIVTRRNRLA